ncbi:hypothetical protein [Mycoplasmopsis agassizii]|uniref:Uncharacterized protein n=1 Tax=Mycoplasmopsis agassizii TaxID=33922 RepID=A0ABX4H5B9_9BACT|nr:hypothetical protein [Mycoplasmopsis agassizii]PAF55002.1 hypothetical protein CJF60_04695 [Mycoplasmopsis agassizii]SMC17586.1 hypothetical protein SAMN02745179_00500 [Mycoplasmopsis agassizii]
MSNEKPAKFKKGNCDKAVKELDKAYDLEEVKNHLTADDRTGNILYEYSAMGTPKQFEPPIDPPGQPGRGNGNGENLQWWQKWTLEKIKESAATTVAILRHEMKQMEKRIEKKFDAKLMQMEKRQEKKFDAKLMQMEKRIEQKFDAKLEKVANEIRSEMKEGFEKAEKQNKDTNDKLEAILELLKKKDK